MPNYFDIPQLNPIRFRRITTLDARYNTFPFDLALQKNFEGCYYQQWQVNDITRIQILSDFVIDNIKVYDMYTKRLRGTVPFAAVPSGILGQTFTCYEAECDFSDIGVGRYYAEVIYTNELLQEIKWQSDPLEVAVSWPNTLLFEYKNEFNDFDIIFQTGIEFSFRCEASIVNFTPEFDDEIYIDQKHAPTKLSAVPYRKFTLLIKQAPDWVQDKVNRILSVTQKQIDGTYYERAQGAKQEMLRTDGNNFSSSTIEIIPSENSYLSLNLGSDDNDEIIIPDKVLKYENVNANFAISSVFRVNSHLTRIIIYNKNNDTFTLTVGTSNGGNQLGQWEIPGTNRSISISYPFDSVTTLYLGGLNGTLCNVWIDYKQYDEPPLGDLPDADSAGRIPIGTAAFYIEREDGDFELHWNPATGLGMTGSPYEGCAWCDGRNGTMDYTNIYPVPAFSSYGTLVGALNHQITQAANQVANHDHRMFTNTVGSSNLTGNNSVAKSSNKGINQDYFVQNGTGVAVDGITSGNNTSVQPMTIQPRSRKTLLYTRIS